MTRFTRLILPLLAAAMFCFAIVTSLRMDQPRPRIASPAEPPRSTFDRTVAGVGIVEPRSETIAISASIAGLIQKIHVNVGDTVAKGDPLFQIDPRPYEAERLVRTQKLAVASQKLAELQARPRPEDLPPAQAKVDAAAAAVAQSEAQLADARSRLQSFEQVSDKRAISVEDWDRRRFAVQIAEQAAANAKAELRRAQSELALLKAGTYAPLLEVAKAEVAQAQAELHSIEVDIGRLTVKAPMDAQVLQVKMRPGEYAPVGILTQPLMTLGVVDPLHVRVDIDEVEAPRVKAGAKAIARLRGQASATASLEFVRFEPLVVPKRALTGEPNERVDTRVLQAIFKLDPKALPVYVGQQLDVFIDASEAPQAVASTFLAR